MNQYQQIIFAVSAAGAFALVGYALSRLFVKGGDRRIHDRLTANSEDERSRRPSQVTKRSQSLMQRIGQAAAEPFMPKDREKLSGLRKQLAQAGVYSPHAVKVVKGFKLILLVGGALLGYMLGLVADQVILGFALGGIVGYLAPVLWLKARISANQKELTMGLPDALDLMVVCVEAGLTVDAAINRVGDELTIAHPSLSRELGLYQLQTQIGLSRQDAMKNLGQRTGNPSLQSFAAMIVQAERFGTSIAGALRVQADTLRVNRQMAAEEMAAKASVKLSFPLVLFIFPATFIVLVGPAVLTMMASGQVF
jgi:tight adherence protein C